MQPSASPVICFMRLLLAFVLLSFSAVAAQGAPQATQSEQRILPKAPGLSLRRVSDRATRNEFWKGRYRVFENREKRSGRQLDLDVIVIPARSARPKPDPIVHLAGGPGMAVTQAYRRAFGSWMRAERDIVLVDQRGTGGSHRLDVDWGKSRSAQGYLGRIFEPKVFASSLDKLRKRADLRWYTTPVAADDLAEVCRALGYKRVNLIGGSYGTRIALVFLRRHEDMVRTAMLNGVAPIAFKNPLYHSAAAQEGFDRICREVASDPEYRRAFGDLRKKLEAVLARLEEAPAKVSIGRSRVELSKAGFLGALRVLMYYTTGNRQVPLLLSRAFDGDYEPFARVALHSKRSLRDSLAFGMLMCVVGSEDIPRITPEEIRSATRGSLWGSTRVREQSAIAKFWPRGVVPKDYGTPVRSTRPVLLLSGTHDPVTPPRWGHEAARHLPNAKHVVVPGCHGVGGPCITSIQRRFLATANAKHLDTSCAKSVRLPRFVMPKTK